MMLVDSREPSEVIENLKVVFPDATVTALDCSDLAMFLSNGTLIIERKTPEDLTASIADKRLFAQCERMGKIDARWRKIVIDGEMKYSDDGRLMGVRGRLGYVPTGWKRKAIRAALRVATQDRDIQIEYTDGEPYADLVREIITSCEKADAPHSNSNRTKVKNPFDDGAQAKIDFLAGLPGVGTERAVNLVQAHLDWGIAELLEGLTKNGRGTTLKIALWGPKSFESIKKYLGLRQSQYLKIETRSEFQEAV